MGTRTSVKARTLSMADQGASGAPEVIPRDHARTPAAANPSSRDHRPGSRQLTSPRPGDQAAAGRDPQRVPEPRGRRGVRPGVGPIVVQLAVTPSPTRTPSMVAASSASPCQLRPPGLIQPSPSGVISTPASVASNRVDAGLVGADPDRGAAGRERHHPVVAQVAGRDRVARPGGVIRAPAVEPGRGAEPEPAGRVLRDRPHVLGLDLLLDAERHRPALAEDRRAVHRAGEDPAIARAGRATARRARGARRAG